MQSFFSFNFSFVQSDNKKKKRTKIHLVENHHIFMDILM